MDFKLEDMALSWMIPDPSEGVAEGVHAFLNKRQLEFKAASRPPQMADSGTAALL